MPRSGRGRTRGKRRRVRQRNARCSFAKGGVEKSSVTPTPEGSSLKGSDSSDSVLQDYMDNVASQLTDSAVSVEKDVVRKMSNLTFSSPAEPVDIGLSPSETASSLNSISRRRLRKRERKKRQWMESYDRELGSVAKRARLMDSSSPLLSSSKSSLCGNSRAQADSEHDSSEHMDVGQPSGMQTDPCRREHHQCISLDDINADSGAIVGGQTRVPAHADCDSSLSESDCDFSCDADDELSCLETPSVPCRAVIPWWDESVPSTAGVYFGDREDTPTTSDQEFSDLVAASLSSLSSGGRRGFQKRLFLANSRNNGGRADVFEKEVEGYLAKLIDEFVTDPSKSRLQLPPMPGRQRKAVYRLAQLYNIKYHVKGNVATCLKTSETCSPGEAAVRAALQRSGRYTSPSQPLSRLTGGGGLPISESNVGNRMLRGMGWQPGTGLGVLNKGILEPISVRKKFGRQGLG